MNEKQAKSMRAGDETRFPLHYFSVSGQFYSSILNCLVRFVDYFGIWGIIGLIVFDFNLLKVIRRAPGAPRREERIV